MVYSDTLYINIHLDGKYLDIRYVIQVDVVYDKHYGEILNTELFLILLKTSYISFYCKYKTF